MSKCKFCGKEIVWMNDGKKATPVEPDGNLHKCDEMINSRKSLKKMTRTSLSPEEIAKYEQGINKRKK